MRIRDAQTQSENFYKKRSEYRIWNKSFKLFFIIYNIFLIIKMMFRDFFPKTSLFKYVYLQKCTFSR